MTVRLSPLLAALLVACAPAMRAQPIPVADAPPMLELAQAQPVPATGAELTATFAPVVRAVVAGCTGAEIGNLSPALADELGVDLLETGVVVIDVREGSPAARVGLRPGDMILRIGATELRSVRDLLAALEARRPGPFRVAIRRQGRVMEATLAG
jgi:S1-C subfamily serine protease